jgi:hypothetical protein
MDDNIRSLFDTIKQTYSFMDDVKELERIGSQAEILKRIAVQTSECGRFIVNYASSRSFCMYRSPIAVMPIKTPIIM